MVVKVAKKGFVLRPKTVIYAVIVLVIVAVLLYLVLGMHGTVVSSNVTATLSPNKSIDFAVSGIKGSYSLFLDSSSNSMATFYLSGLPVLTSPILEFRLSNGTSVNVSLNGSSYAHVQVKLLSLSQSQAEVRLTRIPSGFGVVQSASVSSFNPSLAILGMPSQGSGAATTVSPTTSAGAGTTTAQATTTAQTTTVKSSSGFTQAQVLAAANGTELGGLMAMYNGLFRTDTACTPSLYNSTYSSVHNRQNAYGATDYYNASRQTPEMLTISTSEVSTDEYDVTYTAVIPAGNRLSLVMLVNVSSGQQVSYQASGIFLDQNYVDMSQNFISVNSIGNDCAAYVG